MRELGTGLRVELGVNGNIFTMSFIVNYMKSVDSEREKETDRKERAEREIYIKRDR